MRIHHYIVALLLFCCAVLPACAADDSTEALAKRVSELEKANLVLQEDLARTQLALDTTTTQLRTALQNEITARQALVDALKQSEEARKSLDTLLGDLQQKFANDMAKMNADLAAHNAGLNTLQAQVAALDTGMAAQAAKHDQDVADLRTGFAVALDQVRDEYGKELASFKDLMAQRLAALQTALDEEKNARIAADEAAEKARAQLVKQQKNDRTVTYVLGGLLGGIAILK